MYLEAGRSDHAFQPVRNLLTASAHQVVIDLTYTDDVNQASLSFKELENLSSSRLVLEVGNDGTGIKDIGSVSGHGAVLPDRSLPAFVV